jgi:cellulose biosynthesis protein BcsQ
MNEPLLVAFSTQKGGAGKTTLTVLTASYLHYVKGYNVAVVDCDFPQFSIKDMRDRDVKSVEQNNNSKMAAYEQFKRLQKKAYPVLESRPEEAVKTAERLINAGMPLDFIFFDLPGTVYNTGIINTIATMDYIFCPIAADRVVMESSLQFASIVNDHLISTGKSNIKGLYFLWNLVDKREKTDLYQIYEQVAGELGIPILKTVLPDSKRFRREIIGDGDKALFRSTLFPPDKSLVKGSNLDQLTSEILTLLKV